MFQPTSQDVSVPHARSRPVEKSVSEHSNRNCKERNINYINPQYVSSVLYNLWIYINGILTYYNLFNHVNGVQYEVHLRRISLTPIRVTPSKHPPSKIA